MQLQPCGPVVDLKAAERLRQVLSLTTEASTILDAWLALAPIFAASPYLAGLARRDPKRLADLVACDPDQRLADILVRTTKARELDAAAAVAPLRRLKQELHLLTALADLGGVWDLDQVTAALTRFADTALTAALWASARSEKAAGRLLSLGEGEAGPVPGWFCIAMGKQGAFELNYSSDIDVSVFFDPERLGPCLAPGVEVLAFAVRLTQAVTDLMQRRTPDGYVFRVDLRLRPDPSSTPHAMSTPAALEYYETVGQNWERAAFIKARACAGDLIAAHDFLAELTPFIWRKALDFAAIADIQAIKRQIHAHKVDDRLQAAGMDVKLGRGGIREIEFYVQTQQLILGGRHPELRNNRTCEALAILAAAGYVTRVAADEMTQAYVRLRNVEHRIQMLADEQTHRLPEAEADRRRVAALSGFAPLRSFDAAIVQTLKTVNRRYGELFADEEPLSSRFGSLVFTGVGDDSETLATLRRMKFSNPAQVSQTIRAWHHGRAAATRTERGRELFTRLAPRLLEAAHATGAPDVAFARFRDFFEGLSSGVQLQSLFLAQPRLFAMMVEAMAFAPRLAQVLARRPAAIDAMVDPDFLAPADLKVARAELIAGTQAAPDFEGAMDAVRRRHRELAFRLGMQVMSGSSTYRPAGQAFADLADMCIEALAPIALAEVERAAGAFPGDLAIIALGKCGSGEMNARSDLDLMTLYRVHDPAAVSQLKGWEAAHFYGRVTQRFIAALSSPTTEGGLYEVDMQLRPSGTKGPVAVSSAAFEDYYAREAETWELLALTRGRIVWATSETFVSEAQASLTAALRQPRDRTLIAADVRSMRALLERERPAKGDWDLKLMPGGLVDIEFAAQGLQLIHAGHGGPLAVNTAQALDALGKAGLIEVAHLEALMTAWRLQQDLTQLLKVALGDNPQPDAEPKRFQALLARAGGARSFKALTSGLAAAQRDARLAFLAITGP